MNETNTACDGVARHETTAVGDAHRSFVCDCGMTVEYVDRDDPAAPMRDEQQDEPDIIAKLDDANRAICTAIGMCMRHPRGLRVRQQLINCGLAIDDAINNLDGDAS